MSKISIDTLPFSSSRTVSWIHIGDLHMTCRGEQNEVDLGRIVDEINRVYAGGGVNFVFIPGDIADDGSAVAYEAVRQHLDRLKLPWCGIVGDHDVHEESFANFRKYISTELYGAFSIGPYRFFRLNALSVPKPDAFILDDEQLGWLERELKECERSGTRAVLLLHCYPSDLKQGGEQLQALLQRYPVLLVDMGHTHYNEISNDGNVIYTATRSTGQIEEGPAGYSLTTLHDDVVSWHFVELGSPELVVITHPEDERLLTHRTATAPAANQLSVSAKTWCCETVVEVSASVDHDSVTLVSQDGLNWGATMDVSKLKDGLHEVNVIATDSEGHKQSSSIRVRKGPLPQRDFADVDQENAIGEWKERGLLGTQLGPNKNGKKW